MSALGAGEQSNKKNNNNKNNNNNNNNNNVKRSEKLTAKMTPEERQDKPNIESLDLQPQLGLHSLPGLPTQEKCSKEPFPYYDTIMDYIYFPISDNSELKDFFTQYIYFIRKVDGDPRWSRKKITHDFERSEYEDKKGYKFCCFTGIQQDRYGADGCKAPRLYPNLKNATQILLDILWFILKYRLDDAKRNTMLKDEELMNLFMLCVRNVFYFLGQNQLENPFVAAPKMFEEFIKKINEVFDKEVIRVLCEDKNEYGCGRFVGHSKCETSGDYFVYIYKTEGPSSMNIPNSVASVTNTSSKTCGGSRTRRHRRKKLRRKTLSRK